VDDVVLANLLALNSEKAVGEVFNIASGVTTSIHELAEVLQRISNVTSSTPIFSEPRKGDIKHNSADIRKAQNLLGFCPKVRLENGLCGLVKWYLQNR
jgi:nucleoside-diphosphate-sugar epimerase